MKETDIRIEDLREMNPQVLTDVHRLYYTDVFRYVGYRVSDIAMVEDITSETFTRLIEALSRGKGPNQDVRSWLMGTASNLVNDFFRNSYRDIPESFKEDLNNSTLPTNDEDILLQRHDLRIALRHLTKEQQHVITLRFGNQYSLNETAEIMSKKIGAIKALQYRALESLRHHLGEVET